MATKFPIGFWNYQPTGKYGPEEVKRWADCGITLTLSPNFDPEQHDKKMMLAYLDACEELGMKMFICDQRTSWSGAASDPEGYRQRFLAAYEDFGHHSATHGFFIGDEPASDQMADCITAYKIQLAEAPDLIPFLNFNPYSPGREQIHWMGKPFSVWLQDFAKESGCKLICYDMYNQMNPEEEGTDRYFENLRRFYEAAHASNVPLWNTVLSVGHFRYRVPSEDDLRWQVSTSIASGCEGLLFFYFYSHGGNNYRTAPIDEYGEKTETYVYLSRVLRRFADDYGTLMPGLKLKQTYHFVKAYGGFPVFEEDTHPLVRRAISVHNLPGIISFFEDENGREYVMLVNNTPYESGQFRIALPPDTKSVLRVRQNGQETDFKQSHHDAFYRESPVEIQAGIWLAPGQMEIFRLEK